MAGVPGYEAEDHEVQAVYDALIGDRDGEDLLPRYMHLSSRQSLLDAVIVRLADERAQLAAELYADLGEGRSFAAVADRLGISRARAQQMIERSRTPMANGR